MAAPSLWYLHPGCKRMEGQTFGRLTVEGPAEKKSYWLCRCECGGRKRVYRSSLIRGSIRSCGCLLRETTIKRNQARMTTHGHTRGGKYSPEFRIWHGMIARCHSPSGLRNPNYGGRNITVCDRWRYDFLAFLADMGPWPGPGYSIERKNNNLGYSPENCVWATVVEQGNNRRYCRHVEWRGQRMTVAQIAKEVSISPSMLYNRLNRGWDIERAISDVPLLNGSQKPRPSIHREGLVGLETVS